MNKIIQVHYKCAYDLDTTKKFIEEELHDINLIACDFEIAPRFTAEELERIREEVKEEIDWEKKRQLEQILAATGLSHPSLTRLTHLSVARSKEQAMVFILLDDAVKEYILDFLVTTSKKQIWHNLGFDGKYLIYYRNKLPLDWEDTLLLAKTYMNHAKNYKCEVGLKSLEGHNYGKWALSKDYFNLEEAYTEKMLLYAATDACATYNLYQEILKETKEK